MLSICCHGDFSSRTALINGKYRNAAGIASIINNLHINNVNHIQLLCCHSADFYSSSLAAELSRIMPNIAVTGYAGEVSARPQPEVSALYFALSNIDSYNKRINDHFMVLEDINQVPYQNRFQFHRIQFKNGSMVNQTSISVSKPSYIDGRVLSYRQL